MGLFEWIGENFNPGRVGTVKRNESTSWQPKNRFLIWLFTLLGVGLFGAFVWIILKGTDKWLWLLLFGLYLFLSWWLTPKPNYRNTGWFGGMIDNPFRISDDFNRWLIFFALFLLPGKIIWYSLQIIINTIRAR